MVSLLILLFAVIALVRFAIMQWRAIWLATANQPLSDALQATAGIDAAMVGAQDFGTLVSLCDRLCPGVEKSTPWLREVSMYYRGVAMMEQVFRKLPAFSAWARSEMQICSRYAAVILDQNLSMSAARFN